MLYVVDTSVFLSDHQVLESLSSKNVIIPLAVLLELEAKRNHPELGYAARSTLRILEQYRRECKTLTNVSTGNGGTVSVECNHVEDSSLPSAFKSDENDTRILAVASNLASEGNDVTLLTQDLPLRLRASIAGVCAEEWDQDRTDVDSLGLIEIDAEGSHIEELYSQGSIAVEENTFPVNTGFIVKGPFGSALARKTDSTTISLVRDKSVFDLKGRSAEQRIALDLLTDPNVGIVSLGGKGGAGKSILALAAGLEAVMERREHRKVIIFRPLYAVGGQDLGYLPGTAEEKMQPWAAAVYDALEAFCGPNVIEEINRRKMLEVLPLTHIRGRTLTDSFVIIDECQNLEKMVLLTALSRMGENSKVVLTHDVAQRDNLRVGKHDGINAVVAALVGHPIFGHIRLTRSERSPIAELVSTLLED